MSTEHRRRVPAADGLLIVGLTGRAGSGKSTVARALASRGAAVIDADALGHQVTDTDPAVRSALRAEYGEDIYRADGSLDRRRVADRVFRDRDARARLDRLVHPPILERIRSSVDALRASGAHRMVVSDAVLVVVAPEAEQVTRLTAARGWTDDEARRRLAAQRPAAEFEAAADVVLYNPSAPPSEVDRRVQAILIELEAILASRTGEERC